MMVSDKMFFFFFLRNQRNAYFLFYFILKMLLEYLFFSLLKEDTQAVFQLSLILFVSSKDSSGHMIGSVCPVWIQRYLFIYFLTPSFKHRKLSLLSTLQFGIEQSSFSTWTWLLFCSQTGTNLCITYLYLSFVRLTFVSDGLLNYFYVFRFILHRI